MINMCLNRGESVSKQSVIKTFKRKPFFMYIYVKTKKKKNGYKEQIELNYWNLYTRQAYSISNRASSILISLFKTTKISFVKLYIKNKSRKSKRIL